MVGFTACGVVAAVSRAVLSVVKIIALPGHSIETRHIGFNVMNSQAMKSIGVIELYAFLVCAAKLFRERRAIKINAERMDFTVLDGKYFSDVADERACRAAQFVVGHRACFFSIYDHISQFHGNDAGVKSFGRFQVRAFAGDLFNRTSETCEDDVVSQE